MTVLKSYGLRFCYGFSVRKLFGTFEKRAPRQLYFFPYGVELNFSFPREAFSPARKRNEFASDSVLVSSAI